MAPSVPVNFISLVSFCDGRQEEEPPNSLPRVLYGLSPQNSILVRDKIVEFIAVCEHPPAVEKPFSPARPSGNGCQTK